MPGNKHLIECHCVLPLFKRRDGNNIYHKFPVYSKIDKDGKIIPKIVKCNNCDTMHYVYDYCKSEIRAGKDQSEITTSIDELSLSLPERLSNVLLKNNVDFSNWEHIIDIFEEKRWGESVVLRRDIMGEKQHVKILEIKIKNVTFLSFKPISIKI